MSRLSAPLSLRLALAGSLTLLPMVAFLPACDDADPSAAGPDAAVDAGSVPALVDAGGADAATGPNDASAPDAAPAPPPPRGLVVVHSDYQSTSVSLLDRAGTILRDDCIGTATVSPKLNVAFSGDVVTPSQPQPDHEVVLIDRTKAMITFVSPDDCSVVRQVSVATGFFSNPHDVVPARAGFVYVTRYEANPDDAAGGSDLLLVERASGTVAGRVPLQPFAAAPVGGKAVLARPDRALNVDGRVYVTLNNLAADFKAAGFGTVVVVNASTDVAEGTIDLAPLKNCGAMQAVPSSRALLVSCNGAYSDGPKQIDHAGLALVRLDATPAKVDVFPASALGRVVSGSSAAALDAKTLFAVTIGDFMGPVPDQLWRVGAAGAAGRKLFDAGASFVLGDLVVDAERGRLFVTDATMTKPRVHVYDVSDPANATRLPDIASGASRGLPPRSLSWY